MELLAPPLEFVVQSTPDHYKVGNQFSVAMAGKSIDIRHLNTKFQTTEENPFQPSESIARVISSNVFLRRNATNGSFNTADNPGFAVLESYQIDKKTGLAHLVNVGLEQRNDEISPKDVILQPNGLSLQDLQARFGWNGFTGYDRPKINMMFGDDAHIFWPSVDMAATRDRFSNPMNLTAEELAFDPVIRAKK